MRSKLAVDIFVVVNVKEDCCVRILEVEKHPIASGDAKGRSVREGANFLDVKLRVGRVLSEALFLNRVESADFAGQSFEGALKLVGADDNHAGAGGYRLTAF